MTTITILALALAAGAVTAGAVWYAWGIAEHLVVMFLSRRKPEAVEKEGGDGGKRPRERAPESKKS